MDNTIMVNPFIQYCEEMTIAEEGLLKNYIEKKKRAREKRRKERTEQIQKNRAEISAYYKSIEPETKSLLFKIIKDYVSFFNKASLRSTHSGEKLDSEVMEYSLDELDGRYYALVCVLEDSYGKSSVAFDEISKCYRDAESYINEKYKKELEGMELSISKSPSEIYFDIYVEYKPSKSTESFIDIVTESAKNMNSVWDSYSDKMQKLRKEINSEEDISKIIKMLSEYYKLVESLKTEIDNAEYSTFDKIKFKVHKTLATALPLASFIGSFAGITILNREVKKKGFDDTIGPIKKFTVSAIAAGGTAILVGSPKDPKKYYTSEISYLLTEIKIQQSIMRGLLCYGIESISEVDDYVVELTSSKIKVTKKEE